MRFQEENGEGRKERVKDFPARVPGEHKSLRESERDRVYMCVRASESVCVCARESEKRRESVRGRNETARYKKEKGGRGRAHASGGGGGGGRGTSARGVCVR